ncbi:MAG: hypothetical protein WC988_00430 [Patescibacteria group bacterium]
MKKIFVDIFLIILFGLEKFGFRIVPVPKVDPNTKTLEAFDLLKRIYTEAEKQGTRLWLTGSWAITGRNGFYIKNIRDIDFTMRTRIDEENFGKLLLSLGLTKVREGPMGANRYVDQKSGIEVDYGSITYPGVYYNMPLKEDEKVISDGFSYRVIPAESHLKVYKHILFCKGRSLKSDLIKIKILLKS